MPRFSTFWRLLPVGFGRSSLPKMASDKTVRRWTLGDLADFEALLASGDAEKGARRIYREEISPQLDRNLAEGERRRQGLRLWLERKRGDDSLLGARLETGLRLAGFVVAVAMGLLGVGIVRGLLHEIPGTEQRGFNLWLFLGVTLGIQWLILLVSSATWLIWRRKGGLSLPQEFIGMLGRRLAGAGASREVWNRLLKMQGRGYGSVLGWRLARLSQLGGEWLNIGMLLGFLGCLWFLKVGVYWESTLSELSGSRLSELSNGLSVPWRLFQPAWVPGEAGVNAAQLGSEAIESQDFVAVMSQIWMPFLMMALLVWGLLPRVILFLICRAGESRALQKLDFQESRHRNLWREMAKVDRAVVKTSQADGVVLLDVGGTGVQLESVRPFLLQNLRVNPQVVHQTGVLDASKEAAALVAMKSAELGVVMVVEGWSLSGPQMKRNYEVVRGAIGDQKPIRFLVVGTVKGASVSEVNEEEFGEWTKFIDSLRDPAAEVVRWEGASLS